MSAPHIKDYKGLLVHMVGIGGSSMSGLAEMLLRQGYRVQGSDRADGYALERLRARGVKAYTGHEPQAVLRTQLLVYSAAIAPGDPERLAARQAGIPQMERAVLLGQLMEHYDETACVCGTHGKTTASAMLAQVLLDCGKDPTVHIGGSLDAIGGGSRVGGSAVFVAEACEFNRSFLHMPPTIAIITNIQEDHLDCYKDLDDIQAAFQQFADSLPETGLCIGLLDDPRVMAVMQRSGRACKTFSLEREADYVPGGLHYDSLGCASFALMHQGEALGQVQLRVPGDFNALHALAALAAAHALRCGMESACASISRFEGVHRRFEFTGEVQGMRLYHDYGHNPAEMKSALSVARLQGRRLIAVMQPHTFSRVKGLFRDYLTCTAAADITLVTDIFAAREQDPGDIHSRMLVKGMKEHGLEAYLTPAFQDTEDWLLHHGRPGDLVLTMGCGDINLLNTRMQKHWDEKTQQRPEEKV